MKNHNSKLKNNIQQRTYLFALDIINFAKLLPRDQANNIVLNQLIRSATSVGANIIEAQASSSKKDFINFYHHSLKSANESKFWLYLLRDTNKGCADKITCLLNECKELANILASSILTMKGKR